MEALIALHDRYEALSRSLPALQNERASLLQREAAASGLLAGSNETLAAADLQGRVKSVVEAAHGELKTTQIMQVQHDGAFRRVGVRGEMTMSIPAVQQVLYALKSTSPTLIVDNLSIRSNAANRQQDRNPDVVKLNVEFGRLRLSEERAVKMSGGRMTGLGSPFSRLTLGLVSCCLILVLVIAVELIDAPDMKIAAQPVAPALRDGGANLPPPFSLAPLQDYAEVVQRPLFSRTRHRAANADEAAPVPAEDMTLVGVVISGAERIALIRSGQNPGKVSRVRYGQEFNGWIVRSIGTDKVVLDKDGDSNALTLRKSANSVPAPVR